MELQKLFAQARVEKGKPYNFLKMVGGRYQIDTKDPFLKLFVQNLFTQKISDGGVIFKVPKSVLYPIIIDIDLDLSANITHCGTGLLRSGLSDSSHFPIGGGERGS